MPEAFEPRYHLQNPSFASGKYFHRALEKNKILFTYPAQTPESPFTSYKASEL